MKHFTIRWIRAFEKSESGQALIEAAISLPLFAVLIIGAAEFARVAYAAIEVSNAARAGAEYGGQNGTTAQDAAGISLAAAADGGNLTSISTTSSYSCVCSNGSASTCLNTDCTNSHLEETVTVNTTTTFDPLIYVPAVTAKTFTLKGRAIQKCLQ